MQTRRTLDNLMIILTCFGGALHRAGIDLEIDCVALFD